MTLFVHPLYQQQAGRLCLRRVDDFEDDTMDGLTVENYGPTIRKAEKAKLLFQSKVALDCSDS